MSNRTHTATSRRTLVQGAAWSAPAVALSTAVPAVAASCTTVRCVTQVIDWDLRANWVRTSNTTGVYTLPLTGSTVSGATTLSANVVQTMSGIMRTGVRGSTEPQWSRQSFNENLTITNGDHDPGVVSTSTGNGLQIRQQPDNGTGVNASTGSRNDRSATTFTFSEPLCSLSFRIRDIDAKADDFVDKVELSSPAAFTTTRGASLRGTGTPIDPWTQTRYADVSPKDDASSVLVNFAVPVQTFTVTYWNSLRVNTANRLDGDQRIFLGDLTVGIRKYVC